VTTDFFTALLGFAAYRFRKNYGVYAKVRQVSCWYATTNIDTAGEISSPRRPAATQSHPPVISGQPARCASTRLAIAAMKTNSDSRFADVAHARVMAAR